MTRAELKAKIQSMNSSLLSSKDKDLEKIVSVVLKCIDGIFDWQEGSQKILEIFIDSLTKAYSFTSQEIKKIYSKVKEFDIEDVLSLTYRSDGKTLEERIKQYCQTGKFMVEEGRSKKEISLFLSTMLDRLLENETLIIRNGVILNKIAPVATILVIETSGADCESGCADYEGEYPADENIPLPPYHPYCSCIYYYIITDDMDDIEDLELEIEESKA